MNEEEITLLNEMKENCLNGAKYIDPKVMEKYNLLRKLEDENQQLKSNWNKLKEWLNEQREKNKICNTTTRSYLRRVEQFIAMQYKMQELEEGKNEN